MADRCRPGSVAAFSIVAHSGLFVRNIHSVRQLCLHTPGWLISARRDFVFKQRAHGASLRIKMAVAGAFPLDKRNLRDEKQPPCPHVFKIILLPLHRQTDSSMTKALKTYIPILALLLAVSLASCDSAETRQRIAAADSLAEASPRAAIALADSLAPGVASRSSRMRLALIKAKAQNKLGMRLPKDTLAMLADYYDSHGSVNERMLADYIQGWACLDNDDTPKALHYFHSAAENADTAANDCDYKTLHKVHVWTAQLLMDNDVLAEAMNENRLAMKYALKAKDTLNALITMEQQANIYDGMDVADSAFTIRRGLYALYMKHGFPRQAAISLGPLVNKLAKLGEFAEAKRCLGVYESKSGLFDGNGNIRGA